MNADRQDRQDRQDRIAGVLLGLACGDALGVPYEFASRALSPDEDPVMVGGGLGPYAPGEYSDDTQMAVVIAQVAARRDLRSDGALDEIVEGWLAWLRAGASDVGNQTRHVLAVAADERSGDPAARRARRAAEDLHRRTGRTAGNGSLMRTAPVALAFVGDPGALSEAARAISGLTHADDVAGDACVLWCHLVRTAVASATVVDPRQFLAEIGVGRRDRWAGWITEAERFGPSAFTPNGSAPRAWQAAWSAVRHPVEAGRYAGSPAAASIAAAVRSGDDTDTVAAIAGSLVGAAYGASALPDSWVSAVHGWPGLDADGLRVLAHAVVDRSADEA